jgi:hypothetical protein
MPRLTPVFCFWPPPSLLDLGSHRSLKLGCCLQGAHMLSKIASMVKGLQAGKLPSCDVSLQFWRLPQADVTANEEFYPPPPLYSLLRRFRRGVQVHSVVPATSQTTPTVLRTITAAPVYRDLCTLSGIFVCRNFRESRGMGVVMKYEHLHLKRFKDSEVTPGCLKARKAFPYDALVAPATTGRSRRVPPTLADARDPSRIP